MWNDDEILKGCIKKDPRAQKLLYEKYCRGLMGVCLRFTGNRDEAEDVLQEGFVKIFLNIENYKAKSSLIAWMRRIIINTAITMYHRNLKHRHHYDVDDFRDKTVADVSWDGAEYTHEELINIIKELPAGYRMVFNLYAIEGYKHKEIAKKMEIDINTSKSQYSRAKKHIQGKLEELRDGETDFEFPVSGFASGSKRGTGNFEPGTWNCFGL
jgi:RNA polymerase sigma factor (sigma-70 family)